MSTTSNNMPDLKALLLRGATNLDRSQWVQVKAMGRTSRWLPLKSFLKSGAAAEALLAAQNMVLLKPMFTALKAKVNALVEFPERVLATQPGWTGSCFALQSGDVIGATGKRPPAATFQLAERRNATKGTLKRWKRDVAAPLAKQPLATFILMVPFAAPLLRLVDHPTNFGFELSGPGGVGKTTICQLAASVVGPMDDVIVSMNSTANAIDQLMIDLRPYVDPGRVEHVALQSGKQAGARAAELAFSMGNGVSKRRYNHRVAERARFVWLTSSNRPFPEMLDGVQRETADAAMERMITLKIDDDREFGIFDRVARGFGTAGEMAASLVQAARDHHGTAVVRYLEKLTKASANQGDKLRAFVAHRQQTFVDSIAEQASTSMSNRVAEAFGLVYAAGELAKLSGVLPRSFDCFAAATHAYELHLRSRREVATPVERLLRVLASPALLDLRETRRAGVTIAMMDQASAVLWKSRDGETEILMTPAQLLRIAPNKPAFLADRGIRAAMVVEEGRRTVKRWTTEEPSRGRYHCFNVQFLRDFGHL